MAHSSSGRQAQKPRKPHPHYPLYAHASGRWAKRIRGKIHYFGPWRDPQVALERYQRQITDILAGRPLRKDDDGLTVADLVNAYLTYKQQLLESGELAQRTFDIYHMVAGLLVATMGRGTPVSVLRQEDFAKLRQQMTKRWGAISVGNHIQVVRSIFKYGFDAELLDKPVRFGPGFKKPSAKTIRQARACRGPRLFTSQEVHKLLDGTTFILRAMILLGVNGGLGNTDLALLPINAIDWLAGWLDYPRMKTGILRRIPLWSETLEALRAVKDRRRPPRKGEDSGLLFVGRNGVDYVGNHKGYRVTAEFNRGCRKTGVVGRTFYDLRRTFQTVGEEGGDLVAVRAIMGHAPVSSDMSAVYRQRVSDDRLLAVANYVHKWLFGVEESKMNNVHRVGG